jgi:hypothetical protein
MSENETKKFVHLTIRTSYKPTLYSCLNVDVILVPKQVFNDGSVVEEHVIISDRFNRVILPFGRTELAFACRNILDLLK